MWIESNTFRTRFRHLVTSGCSFTSNRTSTDNAPYAWPDMLADWCGLKIHNLAVPGAGNDHVAHSLILYLEKANLDPAETLVLPMWTGPARIDWITDRASSKFGSQYQFDYHYDEHNELTLGGHWWLHHRPTHLIKTLQEYSKYQSTSSFALKTWLAMQSVQNYLLAKHYTFYFTSFFSPNSLSLIDKPINIVEELERIKLSLDMNHWLPMANEDYYGNWCNRMNMVDTDGYHPANNANLEWPQQVLVPCLKQLGIINE